MSISSINHTNMISSPFAPKNTPSSPSPQHFPLPQTTINAISKSYGCLTKSDDAACPCLSNRQFSRKLKPNDINIGNVKDFVTHLVSRKQNLNFQNFQDLHSILQLISAIDENGFATPLTSFEQFRSDRSYIIHAHAHAHAHASGKSTDSEVLYIPSLKHRNANAPAGPVYIRQEDGTFKTITQFLTLNEEELAQFIEAFESLMNAGTLANLKPKIQKTEPHGQETKPLGQPAMQSAILEYQPRQPHQDGHRPNSPISIEQRRRELEVAGEAKARKQHQNLKRYQEKLATYLRKLEIVIAKEQLKEDILREEQHSEQLKNLHRSVAKVANDIKEEVQRVLPRFNKKVIDLHYSVCNDLKQILATAGGLSGARRDAIPLLVTKVSAKLKIYFTAIAGTHAGIGASSHPIIDCQG